MGQAHLDKETLAAQFLERKVRQIIRLLAAVVLVLRAETLLLQQRAALAAQAQRQASLAHQ